MKTLGQVAYEAFGDTRKWRSITGYPLNSWEDLDKTKQYEWQQIGEAVSAYALEQAKGVPSSTSGDEQDRDVEVDDGPTV